GSASGNFNISNSGTADLVVSSITSDNGVFTVSPPSLTLNPGQSGPVIVTFMPSATGSQSASLTVLSNDPDQPSQTVSLSGTGLAVPVPVIAISGSSLNLGDVTLGGSASGNFN